MPAQMFDLCRKKRVSDFFAREAVAQHREAMRHRGQKPVAASHVAQLMDPVPDIHPELFKRISASGHRASGPRTEVVPVIHENGSDRFALLGRSRPRAYRFEISRWIQQMM